MFLEQRYEREPSSDGAAVEEPLVALEGATDRCEKQRPRGKAADAGQVFFGQVYGRLHPTPPLPTGEWGESSSQMGVSSLVFL